MGATSASINEKCIITVTHKICLVNEDGVDTATFKKYSDTVKENIEKCWGRTTFDWKCCKVKFEFIYYNEPKFMETDNKYIHSTNGRAKTWPWGNSHLYVNYDDAHADPNNTFSSSAHEVGHELGADDQYTEITGADGKPYLGPPKPGGYSTNGIMYTEKGTPQKEDIDQIMNSIGFACPDECCKKHRLKIKYKRKHTVKFLLQK